MAVLEVSIIPVGTESPSFSSFVTDALKEVESQNVKYTITPTSTVLEGDAEALMEIAKKLHQQSLSKSDRVVTNIQVDDRKDVDVSLEGMVNTVRTELGQK